MRQKHLKTLSALLALVLLFSAVPLATQAEAFAATFSLTTDKETVQPGKPFTITVSLTQGAMSRGYIYVDYDTGTLSANQDDVQFVELGYEATHTAKFFEEGAVCVLTFQQPSDTYGYEDPSLFTLQLTVPEDAADGTEYEEHPFFEASSIRKVGEKYYFIYSSQQNHELCYATSDKPDCDFVFGGTIVSNGDVGLNGRTNKDRLNMTGTTHGSIELINGQWYVFYHRLTHKSDYSRQGCAERIEIAPDGSIKQVEITSCGLNGGPLRAEGTYPAVIACHITNGNMPHGTNKRLEEHFPNVSHGEYNGVTERYIDEIGDGTLVGFKYFDYKGNDTLTLAIDAKAPAKAEVSTAIDASPIGEIEISPTNGFESFSASLDFPKGKGALYLKFKTEQELRLLSVTF